MLRQTVIMYYTYSSICSTGRNYSCKMWIWNKNKQRKNSPSPIVVITVVQKRSALGTSQAMGPGVTVREPFTEEKEARLRSGPKKNSWVMSSGLKQVRLSVIRTQLTVKLHL